MRLLVTVVFLLCAAAVTPARAQQDSGAMLFYQCNVAVMDGRGVDSAMCVGYLIGMMEGLLAAKPPALCLVGTASSTRLAMIYTGWIRMHPEDMQAHRAFSAIRALRDAFPCEAPVLPPAKRRR